MEADKAFHEEYKVKKKRQLLSYAAWMFVEEVMELVELKPLKNSILGIPRVNGRLPE
ncbi:BnaC08g21530D [Brassica napus]|uniref:BnaC08g21530D protein n=1 Tax=Brassica napus TaxID=3708 RepID=A0A078FT85_BRANA|nr:BnaC08g21530D [Brassica napus]